MDPAAESLIQPLFSAVESGDYEGTARLLESGADPNSRNRAGETPLMVSADCEHMRVAELLLQWGADVNARDDGGNSALLNAVWNNDLETTRVLLNSRADPNIINNCGFSGLESCLLYDDRVAMLELLLARGLTPNLQMRDDWSALISALRSP